MIQRNSAHPKADAAKSGAAKQLKLQLNAGEVHIRALYLHRNFQ
jgi:hypothetical protein